MTESETSLIIDMQHKSTAKILQAVEELKVAYRELEKESRAKENCWNCAYYKEKKYQACVDIKKNNTKRCAFYKWVGEK